MNGGHSTGLFYHFLTFLCSSILREQRPERAASSVSDLFLSNLGATAEGTLKSSHRILSGAAICSNALVSGQVDYLKSD